MIKGMSDSDRINDYIDQIYSDLRKYTPKGLTDNKQLDFILNKYSVQCDAEKYCLQRIFELQTLPL